MERSFLPLSTLPALLMLVGTGLICYAARRYVTGRLARIYSSERSKGTPRTKSDEGCSGEDRVPANMFVCTTCCEGKRPDAKEPNKLPTGPDLFRAIVAKLVPDAAPVDVEQSYVAVTPGGSRLRLIPQRCLGACRQSNCVALSHPHKYQYHFAQLDTTCAQDVEDLVTFAVHYAEESGSVYTKKAERPGKLATGCISRLPPPIVPEEGQGKPSP